MTTSLNIVRRRLFFITMWTFENGVRIAIDSCWCQVGHSLPIGALTLALNAVVFHISLPRAQLLKAQPKICNWETTSKFPNLLLWQVSFPSLLTRSLWVLQALTVFELTMSCSYPSVRLCGPLEEQWLCQFCNTWAGQGHMYRMIRFSG